MHEDGISYRIIGVMPRGLDYPRGADTRMPMLAVTPAQNLRFVAVNLVNRLTPTATVANARDEMTAYFERDGAPAMYRDLRGAAHPLLSLTLGDARPAVLVFAAASGLLLLMPTDGTTLVAVALLLTTVAAVASIIPARSSTRIRPVVALRAD